jgi:hypothetical protein
MAPVGEVTVALAAAVEMICAADPTALGDGETLVALHRHMERLEAAATRVTAAFDAGGSWEAEGARSVATWISTRCHLAHFRLPAAGSIWDGSCVLCLGWRRRG